MPDAKTRARCECGYEVAAYDEAALVKAIRRHARDAHGTVCTLEEALAVILRADLDAGTIDPPRRAAPEGHRAQKRSAEGRLEDVEDQ